MDKSVILEIVTGRVEPKIYAFLTATVPRFLKVGDTYRPVRVRIGEWKEKGFAIGKKGGKPIEGIDYDSWSASLRQGVFFRDYEVHKYLTKIAGMKQITPAIMAALPRAKESDAGAKRPYSQEFFRYAVEGGNLATGINEVSAAVEKAITDIQQYYGNKDHKLSYRIFDANAKVVASKEKAKIKKQPRKNQEEAIRRFVSAIGAPPHKVKLLMYAVMRFGKTFTSLCCARKMQARLVVVLSAKADVSDEWRNEVETTANFADYEFLNADSLKRNDNILEQIKTKKKSFVVFLTLQTFLKKKEWLTGLFKKKIDLLIVDETHFGARAEKLGKVLEEKKKSAAEKKIDADVDRDDDAKDGTGGKDEVETVKQISLHSTVTLHLSGTPYRILMKGEFPDDKIIAFCQYTDIIAAQKAWDRDCLGKLKPDSADEEYSEWDNPYYGFPEMVRFAFNPSPQALKLIEDARERGETCSFSEIFCPEVDVDGNFNGRFVHQAEVEEFLRIFNGSDEGENVGFPSLLKFLQDNKRDICRHMVMVLPYCASCDAMAALLKSGKYPNLAKYEVLNISGHARDAVFNDPAEVKARIKSLAESDKRTLTLTVNRMLTGSTVPEWDTMIFLKETKSPQEYDQAIFRLQSPYVQLIPSQDDTGNQTFIKRNLKPQTLLVDFNPSRMFEMQELKGRIYIENKGKKGKRELEKRIQEELNVSPIIFANGDKLKVASKTDVVDEVRRYSGTRGVSEEVLEMDVDLDVLDDSKRLRMAVENENMLDAKRGIRIGASDGDEDDFDPLAKRSQKPVEKSADEKKEEAKDPKKALASQFRSYYRRILFFVFLIDDRVDDLDGVIDAIVPEKKNNIRIAKHLRLNKYDLADLKKMKETVLHQLEYGISRISELAHDEKKKDPVERALVAVRKFGRLGEAEIVTPQHIARDMVNLIPDCEWKRMIKSGETILDPAAKIGEFAVAIVRKLRESGVAENDYKKALLAIPTSATSYEFTRKVYELLGLDVKCVALPENMTSYDLLKVKKADGKSLDYEHIKSLLTQNKDFNKISIIDKISGKAKTMCKKIGLMISNPPYQELDGGAQVSAIPIYPMYVGVGSETSERYSSFIMPARWYAGGKGIDEFRDDMLNDEHIAEFHDFPMTDDCFPGVNIRGGLCFYLRDCRHDGKTTATKYYSHLDSKHPTVSERNLKVRDSNIMIRYDQGVAILEKIFSSESVESMIAHVSAAKAFGLRTFFINDERFHSGKSGLLHPIKCYGRGGSVGYVEKCDVPSHEDWIPRWKVYIPEANNIGTELNDDNQNAIVGGPGTICTETYLVVGAELNLTRESSKSLANYLKTRFARFLVSLAKSSQHGTSKTFRFVPLQDFTSSSDIDWSRPIPEIDEQLYTKYDIAEYKGFIESMIKPME